MRLSLANSHAVASDQLPIHLIAEKLQTSLSEEASSHSPIMRQRMIQWRNKNPKHRGRLSLWSYGPLIMIFSCSSADRLNGVKKTLVTNSNSHGHLQEHQAYSVEIVDTCENAAKH